MLLKQTRASTQYATRVQSRTTPWTVLSYVVGGCWLWFGYATCTDELEFAASSRIFPQVGALNRIWDQRLKMF